MLILFTGTPSTPRLLQAPSGKRFVTTTRWLGWCRGRRTFRAPSNTSCWTPAPGSRYSDGMRCKLKLFLLWTNRTQEGHFNTLKIFVFIVYLKGEKDWQKYETARRLKKCVDRIRNQYREDWKSKEMRIRQRAVALYFIDKVRCIVTAYFFFCHCTTDA